jgi:hypothetical protein
VFGAFDPSGDPVQFFERKPWQSLIGALLLVGGGLGGAFYFASLEAEEPVEEEIVTAQIHALELEEELEDEPELEEPPPPPEPPPPSSEPVKRSKPTPQPVIVNPDEIDARPEPGEIDSEGPGYGEGGGGGNSQGTGEPKPEPPEPKPEVKPKPASKPKPKAFPYNPDKPIERPADATVPKQIDGNPPVYPADLKKRNITGQVKVRLTIYKDGTVKGAKVLAKSNSVDPDAEPDLYEKANKLLLSAVAAAVQTWKFKPSTYEGKPISVFLTVTIPFTLK